MIRSDFAQPLTTCLYLCSDFQQGTNTIVDHLCMDDLDPVVATAENQALLNGGGPEVLGIWDESERLVGRACSTWLLGQGCQRGRKRRLEI